MSAAKEAQISVALCTYNGARHVRAQLESILAQDARPSEIVVCDDDSTDDTLGIVAEMLQAANLPHRIERNATRLGSSSNFGKAFSLCSHDVIVPCDQDDRWHPNKLSALARTLEQNPRAGMVFSNARMIDEDDGDLGYTQWDSAMFGRPEQELAARGDLLSVLLRYPVVCGATMAFRRSLLPLALPIADEWVHDEWIAWLCAATTDAAFIAEPLIDYRRHSGQQIGAARTLFRRQFVTALNLDYFERQVRRFERLRERLEQWRALLQSDALANVEAKLSYQRERVRIRRFPKDRWWTSTRDWLDGGHDRFGLGWKSWLFDLGHVWVPPA